jgi:carboxymethylenebutenolidase
LKLVFIHVNRDIAFIRVVGCNELGSRCDDRLPVHHLGTIPTRLLYARVLWRFAMIVTHEHTDILVDGSAMRVLVTAPRAEGRYPGILMYSDIFQITAPQARVSARLAGYGFVVATPEIYHRIEAPGTALPFDDEGRARGQKDALATRIAEFDADARASLAYLAEHPRVKKDRLGAAGFCTGGHLAFRAAMRPEVRATVCYYPTGVHDGKLGKEADAGSLARAGEIHGDLFLVFGKDDPHVPEHGRRTIQAALEKAGVRFATKVYPAEHAFMRDVGPRYDPEATDDAWRETILFLRRTLGD